MKRFGDEEDAKAKKGLFWTIKGEGEKVQVVFLAGWGSSRGSRRRGNGYSQNAEEVRARYKLA